MDSITTGSLEKSDELPRIFQTDAELIKTVVTDSRNLEDDIEGFAWSNPGTGNNGMIITIETFINPDNLKCKNFQSTINGFTGVLLYDGQACETENGAWILSSFKQR